MREEEGSWFARWEEELPSPEELMPLSQTLITPDLALAFDIPTSNSPPAPSLHHQPPPPPSAEFDSGDIGGGGGDEPARTLKRPRLVWTPQLHKRFVDAVAHLGIKNAVPKTIMQLMSVDGLTRENVASHLQKYRLYLKRMQGPNSSGAGTGGPISAEDQLFASAPYPHPHQYFPRPAVPDHFMPYPVAALQSRQTMAAAAVQQQQYYHQRQMGHFPPPATIGGVGFDNGFLSRVTPQPGPGIHRMSGAAIHPPPQSEDLDSGPRRATRVLTLFPTGDD